MMPSGSAQMTASKVPQIATCRVTIISSTYMRQSVKSGGKKSDIRVRMLPPCSTSAMGFISAPRQAQASMARTRPQMTRRQVSARRSRGGCRAIFISASITMRSLCPVPATCRVRPAYARSRRSWRPFPWHPYPLPSSTVLARNSSSWRSGISWLLSDLMKGPHCRAVRILRACSTFSPFTP